MSGDTYEGEWKEGKRDGRGIHRWNHNGKVYDGDFLNGKKHGDGICTQWNGIKYR